MTLAKEPKMIDPLIQFDWLNLYDNYDRLCKKFKPSAPFLEALSPRPASDRSLYYLDAQAKPVLRVKSGDTVQIQTRRGST